MRARLNKLQMQMLLDGKVLTYGRKGFVLPDGESGAEIRKTLQTIISDAYLLENCDVFADMEARTIIIARDRLTARYMVNLGLGGDAE